MDFNVFADAFSHNRRSPEHLANLLRNRVDSSPEFALFLGAGASVSSGVRPAGQMIEEWRRRLYAAARTSVSYEAWLRQQDWFEADEEYSILFERMYDQPSQRRAFIENEVRSAKPAWGYAYLVSLLEDGVFNTVFTTNFDDLVNEACFVFGTNLRPIVCAHDSAVTSIRVTSERPKVLKLHGDFLYDSIKNTTTELQNLEQNMREKFTEFAREFGLVVMGYSGSDKSVMDLLDVLVRSPNYFRNGIYWCVRKGSVPGRRLRQLLRNDRVFWVEIETFDESMHSLADSLNSGLPRGLRAPHTVGLTRIQHLLDSEGFGSARLDPRIRQDQSRLKETLDRVRRAFEEHHLSTADLDPSNDNVTNFLGTMEATGLSILKAAAAFEAGSYQEAAQYYGLVRNSSEDPELRAQALWDELRCYLLMENTEGQIRSVLASLKDDSAESQHFVNKSFFFLLLNEAESGLRCADKALELNPARAAAMVNRGGALLRLGRADELAAAVNWLISPRNEPQHQAAGYALAGDLDRMVACLQRAMIVGKYSAREAARDVIFRPYWSTPAFVNLIRQFSAGEKIAVPGLKCCLELHPAEAALRDKANGVAPQKPKGSAKRKSTGSRPLLPIVGESK